MAKAKAKQGGKREKFDVVGIEFRVTTPTLKQMEKALPLHAKIEREAKNPNDPNALKVVLKDKPWENFHIGYLRRQVAEQFAPLVDEGQLRLADGVIRFLDADHSLAVVTLSLRPG